MKTKANLTWKEKLAKRAKWLERRRSLTETQYAELEELWHILWEISR